MSIQKRVDALREKMLKRQIDAYIIPSSDPHQSEYLSEHDKTREYISGFTGSAGTAVVTRNHCGVWVDGRYFLQVEKELEGTPFQYYRLGTEDPTIEDFLLQKLPAFIKIGMDGKCISLSQYKALSKKMPNAVLVTDLDYIGEIWEDRPAKSKEKAFEYDITYVGQSIHEKLAVLRYMMRDRDVDYTLIAAPEDICYLFNIRGNDVEDTPVVLSYALISMDSATFFVDPDKLTDPLIEKLNQEGVDIEAYDEIYNALPLIEGQKVVYLDPDRTNYALYSSLNNNVKVKQGVNLTSYMKAIKNEVEIENTRHAFVKDGVALVKFFNWVETGAQIGSLTEQNAVKKLHQFRMEQEDFIEDSFSAIIGYAENAAIVHYDPMKNDMPKKLEPRGLLLVDSGGHYLQGTTDITRTVALGELTFEEKTDYTLVLKAHIAGMRAKFPEGTVGAHIDSIVRNPLYEAGKDFKHGTGHGVGHLLSVHEGPQGFSKNAKDVEITEGMITSMEPGLYIADSHGIRIESITLCVKGEKTEFGQFLEFESLTWVPIDTRPIIRHMLTADEVKWLNDYNRTCYEKLSPYLEGEEKDYLTEMCRSIGEPFSEMKMK